MKHEQLTADDYFRRSREFRLWLKERRDLTLDKLSSRDAHAQFDTFVRRWNAGELKERYYTLDTARQANTTSGIEAGELSSHKWDFASKMRPDDGLLPLDGSNANMHMREEPRDRAAPMAVAHTVQRIPNTRDENPDKRDRKHHSSHEHSSKRKHRDELLEELVPRETGRDARLEKRRERGSFVREKAAEKDAAGTDLEIREGDLMGGGESFQAARAHAARMAQRKDQRMQQRRGNVEELRERHQAKEQQTMDMFKQMAARFQQQ